MLCQGLCGRFNKADSRGSICAVQVWLQVRLSVENYDIYGVIYLCWVQIDQQGASPPPLSQLCTPYSDLDLCVYLST